MLKPLLARLRQGYRTVPYPGAEAALPARFRGKPCLDPAACVADCRACVEACPTGAVGHAGGRTSIDLGLCLFCQACAEACPRQALRFTREHRMAARTREELVVPAPPPGPADGREPAGREIARLFGRSLKLRQVSAGGCNACEADTNVLGTVVFDLGRFGVQFVASPRHADGLLITGPVPENMRLALLKTYAAVPAPKLVIAVGACAISGGPYVGHGETHNGAGSLVPVDLYVPGCPPHPLTILDGILGLLGRLPRDANAAVRTPARA